MTACLARTGHCCWIRGEVCGFLRDDGIQAVRRFVCTLRERLGSWEAVYSDAGYQTLGVKEKIGVECGDWPPAGVTCEECGNG